MPLPRTFGSDTKRRSPLHTVAEEDELDNDDDDILSLLENKGKPTARPKSASLVVETKASKLDSVILDQLNGLSNDVRAVLDKQQELSVDQSDVLDAKLEQLLGFQSSIISGQSEVAALCQGIAQLKNWLESTHNNHDDTLADSIELLMRSVAKHNEDLIDLTTAFKAALKAQKTSSADQMESLDSLKRESIENRSLLEDMWASYEKNCALLRKEQEALLAEKEKISQDRILLEQSEALFEQRKLAAKDNIDYADEMMRKMHETEAKVSSEMERLAQLSDFVVEKNAEAEEKLAEAQRISNDLKEWQFVIGSEHDAVARLKREVEDDRMKLSRDRLSLLKSKPSNISRNPLGRSTKVNLMNDFCSTNPDDLRRRLSAVKSEMKRLNDV
ncbi:hypothetical protein ACHAWT_010951 [Skeletonema menzelii]